MNKKIISELWIYPIKSLGGIRLYAAKVLPKGIEFDRRWMLIDAENKFMTQRETPQLALFRLAFENGEFITSFYDKNITIPFTYQSEVISAEIWNDRVDVYEVSKQHSEWFSEILGENCRLVSFPENNSRPVDPVYVTNNEHVSLADAYPLLIIGQSSLDDLNNRMEKSLPMNRFRPNIVFTGGEPYEEDEWKNFLSGKINWQQLSHVQDV